MMTDTIRIAGISHVLTPWLAGDEKPTREGVYRRQFPAGPYSCWGGDRWMQDAQTPDAAVAQLMASLHQRAPWRGLAESSGLPCGTCRGHGVIDHGVDDDTGTDRSVGAASSRGSEIRPGR